MWRAALEASPPRNHLDKFLKDPTAPSLHWSVGAPPFLVAFGTTIIYICLREWESGAHRPILLRGAPFADVYEQILTRILEQWASSDRQGELVRRNFRLWVTTIP